MANPDVTDATLAFLKGFDRLKELDVSDSQITDEGLKLLASLPVLESLRLKNTKITDAGFRDALAAKESLQRLDLTGTPVDRETVDVWRKARPGRRAMQ
jgi:Leucine-rich repeat (LRR) protein